MMHMKSVLDLSRMKEIAISNKSALREVIFWDHCSLNERSLRFINKVLDNNNGSLTITPRVTFFSTLSWSS